MTVRDTLTEIVRQWAATHDAADNLPDLVADAYRAEVLREAARVLEDTDRDDDAVNLLDLLADGAASCPDIHHGLTRPHTTTECPKDGDPR